MAYGTSAGVTLLLGGTDNQTFTSANITSAIAMADTVVDSINSNADSGKKTLASNIIATQILLRGRVNYKTGGVGSRTGRTGAEDVSYMLHDVVTPEVKRLLGYQPSIKFGSDDD